MDYSAIIIGAGASGLMCAMGAAARGRDLLIIDHRSDFGQKILVSGGGHCNFTNVDMHAGSFISANPHFVKSALARFAPADFTELLDRHGIGYLEKDAGQLFLKGSSKRLLDMLIDEAEGCGAKIASGRVSSIRKKDHFCVKGSFGEVRAGKLVVATGGISWPKLGASDFGYRIAKQFGHRIVPPRPALVPLTLSSGDRKQFSKLSGVSFRAKVSLGKAAIVDDCLITHTGLSGPAILRISAYWSEGDELILDLFPDIDLFAILDERRGAGSRVQLKTLLSHHLPSRFVEMFCARYVKSQPMNEYSIKELRAVERALGSFGIVPDGTEGFGKAEVTAGGVDTGEIFQKTMESKLCPGLYFIGEVLDVTGDLGGYNLHWAWASGHAAGGAI